MTNAKFFQVVVILSASPVSEFEVIKYEHLLFSMHTLMHNQIQVNAETTIIQIIICISVCQGICNFIALYTESRDNILIMLF